MIVHQCLSNVWVTSLFIFWEKLPVSVVSMSRSQLECDIGYDLSDSEMRREWSHTPWLCSYEMKTISTLTFSGQIRLIMSFQVICHIMIIFVEGVHSWQETCRLPEGRHLWAGERAQRLQAALAECDQAANYTRYYSYSRWSWWLMRIYTFFRTNGAREC